MMLWMVRRVSPIRYVRRRFGQSFGNRRDTRNRRGKLDEQSLLAFVRKVGSWKTEREIWEGKNKKPPGFAASAVLREVCPGARAYLSSAGEENQK
jgi:hypothetical protein